MAKFVAGKELLWTPIWITKNHEESISLYFRRYLKFFVVSYMQTSIKRILMTGVLGFALCTFAHAQYVNNMGTLISMNIVYNVEDGGHLDVRSGSLEGVNVISHRNKIAHFAPLLFSRPQQNRTRKIWRFCWTVAIFAS